MKTFVDHFLVHVNVLFMNFQKFKVLFVFTDLSKY